MSRTRSTACRAIALATLIAILAACERPGPAPDGAGSEIAAAVANNASTQGGDVVAAAGKAFDTGTIPVSSVELGAFPYLSVPDGYRALTAPEESLDFAQVAFWTGNGFETIEGRVYATGIKRDPAKGKQYSALEVERNLEHVALSAGAVKIFSGVPSKAARDDKTIESLMQQHDSLAKCPPNSPVQVYVVRRADRDIWMRACQSRKYAGLIVAETRALVPTAALLPADKLKQQIDADGKVALQVNFATDKAEILAESRPQIEQVLQLRFREREARSAAESRR